MDWINLAQDRDRCPAALLNAATNLRESQYAGDFLTS